MSKGGSPGFIEKLQRSYGMEGCEFFRLLLTSAGLCVTLVCFPAQAVLCIYTEGQNQG